MTIQQHASFDSSAAELNATSKLVKAWESKNAKNAARAGGVSLMALSLAACGGSSTPVADAPAAEVPVVDTPAVDAAVVKALQISSTTGVYDDAKGGSGDDTFIAGAGSLETGDAVDGGLGTDTLTATYTADASVIASISNVETVNIRAYGSDVDVTVDMDSISGATAVYADRMDNVAAANQASTTFNNMTIGTTAGINGGAAAASSAGDVTFAFKAATGSADAVTLDLKSALVNDVTIASIETVNINSGGTGANLLADLVVANAATIVVTGDQNLTITNEVDMADTTVATAGAIDGTVNASALTGALSFTPNASDNMSITGGSGDDTFAMTSGLDKYDLLDGGTGDDTVSVTAVADGTTLDLSTYSFTSIDTFQVTGAAGASEDPTDITVAADAAGVSKLVLVESQAHTDGGDGADEGTFTVTGLSSGNTIRLESDKVDATANQVSQIGSVTLSMLDGSATTDSLTVELAGTTAQTAIENTVDDLAVTQVETLNIVSTHTGTLATSVLTATDDNTLGDISTDTKLTTLNISGTDQASITVGSEATKLATVNTAGMSNDLALTLQATVDQTVTGGAAAETVAFGGTLNNADSVNLGAGTDVISATSTSLTATTGALNITDVETINLTNTGTAVIDATSITGATEIATLTNTTKTTITGLEAGVAVGIGHNDTDGATAGLFDVALADATGTADALTFNLNNTNAGNNAVELKAAGVETVTLKQTDTTDTALADYTFDVDSLNASKIVVEGSKADVTNAITLTALDTDTTAVDATGFYGVLTAASGLATATTFDIRGNTTSSLTGSSKNDTFNVTTAMSNDLMTIDGNGGTDVLNMILGSGAQDFDKVTDVDTINFTSSGTVAITTNGDSAVLDGINEATKVTFAGGNSISTVTLGGSGDVLTATNSAVLDFSGWNGALSDATFGADLFDNGEAGITVQVVGSSLKDTVSASYDAGTDPTVSLNTQGVEVFDIDLVDDAAELRVDMALVTGMTTINVTDASAERVEFYNLGTGVTIDVHSDLHTAATTVEVVLADATGSTDAQTFIVAAENGDDDVALVAADIETINISSDTAAQVNLSLAGISMTASTARNTVNFTGANDIELIAVNADVTTIDASGMATGGALVQSGRSATEASTYTGSAGNDTFIMMNAGDILDGGTGTGDTLDINMTQAVGTAIIDLSAADQISSLNGGLNAASQTGFENVDLAGLTINGAVVTGTSAANTITGSGLVDQIDGGSGDDNITGGAGDDVMTGGAGADTFFITATGESDTIVDFVGGTDIISLTQSGNFALDSTDADLADANEYLEIASAAGGDFSTLTTTSDVIVLTDTTGFTVAEVGDNLDANVAAADAVVVFFNSATSKVNVLYDADIDDTTDGTVFLILDNYAAADLAAFTSADFVLA